jgi:hypothetical protein
MALLLALPLGSLAQAAGEDAPQKQLTQEELAQLLAPIALYPDELVAQILMASTYPIEVVQADRWAKSHKQSAGDALTKQLEKESWDPSVKSLVSFPTVLASMSEKLDVTTKIGDAFLAQQKEVMETIQVLRKKAYEAGNLKTTKEQKIVVEKEIIVIQPANPQVIYVPTYSPTVVYGVWAYPAYPPYYYYPPPPPYAPAFAFAAGVAIGAAWHNNSGNCNWHGNNVYVNNSNNINVNRNQNANINRGQGGQGAWQHNPEHRKGVAYKDGATAQKYGQSAAQSGAGRNAARGYGSGGTGAAAGSRPSTGSMDRGGSAASGRDSAFSGRGGSGQQERAASDRGQASRQSAGVGNRSMPGSGFGGSGASRSGGGFSGGGGGASRSGGGGRGGGGGRR